jgi:hypothetical protein
MKLPGEVSKRRNDIYGHSDPTLSGACCYYDWSCACMATKSVFCRSHLGSALSCVSIFQVYRDLV